MPDRIDPGPGWRLLEVGEVRPRGYQYFGDYSQKWFDGHGVGRVVDEGGNPCRVRIATTVKGLATRATVRVVTNDGTAERSMRCDSGLSVGQMYAAIASFDLAVDALRNRISAPKYIMLEIQRGPNDY